MSVLAADQNDVSRVGRANREMKRWTGPGTLHRRQVREQCMVLREMLDDVERAEPRQIAIGKTSQFRSDLAIDILSKTPNRAVASDTDEEPRRRHTARIVDCDQVTVAIVREQRINVELHQLAVANHETVHAI
jgi:hypothetical protein